MSWDIILFDLDGTLTESGPGIMKAGQYALRAFGIERDWHDLSFFVGPPLNETFARFVPAQDVPQSRNSANTIKRTAGSTTLPTPAFRSCSRT